MPRVPGHGSDEPAEAPVVDPRPLPARIPALIIGAGQAGLATSHELANRGVEHLVLERGRIGETWRTRRWRSFRLVSPNWLNRLPGYWYDGPDPGGFLTAAEMSAYLVGYAESFDSPVRTGVSVVSVAPSTKGFDVLTSRGRVVADAVVVATGAFGVPRLPALASAVPRGIISIHTDRYRAPDDLPPGGALVVGAGQAGLQIADELLHAGRAVVVSVGRHGWVPRRVYGRDQMYWRLENGDFRSVVGDPGAPSAGYPFTALSRWGTEDFTVRTVWQHGARLAGHLSAILGRTVSFDDDLHATLRAGDDYARTFVGRVRAFAQGRGETVPDVDSQLGSAWRDGGLPTGLTSLELAPGGFSAVIWATGYRHDFSWLGVPGVLSPEGVPYQREGASRAPGLYFVGLHRGWHAADGTVLGAGWLAGSVADSIASSLAAGPTVSRLG